MKKILSFTLIAFTILSLFNCTTDNEVQPLPLVVYNGNLTLKTQAEVDAYGAQGYNVINGYLNIGDRLTDFSTPEPSDITDLSPLRSIIQVTKQVEIQSNPMLTSLAGLENLQAVSGLIVNDNENLTSLNGLEGLRTITGNSIGIGQVIINGGVISLFKNPSLASIEALGNINPQSIRQISINNSSLTSLAGLENIVHISNLNVINNDALTSLNALEGLTTLDTSVFIRGNDNLTNYCILQSALQNNTTLLGFNVLENQFNPTQQHIIDGNCSQ
ncbi:hypothetical protein U8527_12305 [Kordia algicida OT-1]|uniref:Receptor L-domain domain-containing protein n=1 Tax=Kordia algicida OT-1 TaxID=391587 RepID=A9E0N5_9FLAO|nr:hypothetical protein [Kordia algicida]EDP95905.1 hypothetical protein KAOT1_05857 [Kordia algicida OT-1]